MNKKDKGEQPIGPLVKKLIQLYRMKSGMLEKDVLDAVKKVLGKHILEETTTVSFREGTLLMKLNSSVLRAELSYSKDKLKDHINSELGEALVREIRLS